MIKIIIGLILLFVVPMLGVGGLGGSGIPQLIGLVLLAWGIIGLVKSRSVGSATSAFGDGYKYHHIFEGTGIAVDPVKKEIKLRGKFKGHGQVERVYHVDSVRNVKTNIQTGGQVYSTNAAIAASNIGIAYNNKMASGLFLDVKDIDFPSWRVAFNVPKEKDNLNRWYEIVNQLIEGDLS